MTRWYRAYAGTVKDDKLAEVSVIACCSRSVAIATWHAILESAAETADAGRIETTARRVAAALGEPVGTIEAVFAAMAEIGMLDGDIVAAWKRRQYESDSSTERSRKHRERRRNADATLQGRSATPPDTEAETDTSVAIAPDVARAAPRRSANSECLVELGRVLDQNHAQAVLDHRNRLRKPMTPHAAALLATSLGQASDPNAAADEMITRGWLAWKPDWGSGNSGQVTRRPKRNSLIDGLNELEARWTSSQVQQPSDMAGSFSNTILRTIELKAGSRDG